ncbi:MULTISPECIES: type II toxin-antitoxin system RelB/DinJ family antitoxin [Bifidobacterium]|uniref:DNA-damage-inducible protein J n=1 Tax=Bifidobacterium reuteri DSM 23975 TaxID=1437610 RepID=A0A087CPM4_9BIFI|nr:MULTISPECIES: type II toxin-antitoxin system RelB/DinJ family antitoxin [Bifidobacterium]KFI85224.1 DNA-damage-inducible protein J [Bifidobacterium reuteri DSM 23975]TPF77803.1 damage-inducible protein J [Bifidobacterium sp. UTCIF-1]TPF80063.1 damage-inducible protein J [Bifidobacterium sp. UTCIF-24]TPF81940.1 damage-inducible protein J [Bifidobacterium sp. UTCIF-3]TPF84070.1 damage-inducible protein J [Bifidobacterium sp. UTCIF-36]
MTMTQMNVRIDDKLKDDVDTVLREQGVSPSDVIRSLWRYIADRRQVPRLETTTEEQARKQRRMRRLTMIDASSGLIQEELLRAGVIDEDTNLLAGQTRQGIRADVYDQKLDDYLNMTRSV